LDRITTMFDNIEEQKRATLNDEKNQLASIRAEKDVAVADLETKKEATLSKKNECDEKSNHVTAAKEEVSKAKEAVSAADSKAEELVAKKTDLAAAQTAFEQLLEASWQPLKEGALVGTSWQKRNKAIVDFLKKVCEQVQMEGSLYDAIEATLRIKPEQRTSFALLALEHAEECFKNRTESIAKEIVALTDEEAAHQAVIDAAKVALTEKEKQQEDAAKDWDSEQDMWVDLEKSVAEVAGQVKSLENKLDDASKIVESLTDELNYFVEIPALLSKLKSPSITNEEPTEMACVDEAEPAPVQEVVEPLEPAPVQLEVA